MYVGEKFFRIVNETSFKIAQTGSGTGTNSGGPGFTFKDEFSPTLRHTPYVLSMANSGPNSNGSQIFFTGNVSIPSLNDVHTIFGLVNDSASQQVIDAIHAADSNGSTITGVSFSRTDPSAQQFDEKAQGLPTVSQPAGNLTVTRGVAATWNFSQAIGPGTVLRAYRSTTLASTPNSWTDLQNGAPLHVGIGYPNGQPSYSSVTLDNAAAPAAFYNLSVAHHPNSVSPSSLANSTLGIDTGLDALYYDFNQNGSGGILYYDPNGGTAYQTFLFQTRSFQSGPHDFTVMVYHPSFQPNYMLIKIGCDSANPGLTEIGGRHSTSYYTFNTLAPWAPFGSGEAVLGR